MSKNINDQITKELVQMAEFYGLTDHQLLYDLDFSNYAEIVLGEIGFEVVVGGVGREQELMRLAAEMYFPLPVLEAFERCTESFSQKMLYMKVPFRLSRYPSMYFTVIEPWGLIFEVLAAFPDLRPALPELKSRVGESPICFLIGFSLDGKSGQRLAKTYILADRPDRDIQAPFLVSHRLCNGKLHDEVKSYTTRVHWDDFKSGERWQQIADFAQSIYGDKYALMKGHSRGATGEDVKLYIFRNDIRENSQYRLATYNYYYDEGMKLLQLGRPAEAVRSFTNAIVYQPEHAHAHNNRGYCHIQLHEYERAIADCRTAIALDPQISAKNLEFAVLQQNSVIV